MLGLFLDFLMLFLSQLDEAVGLRARLGSSGRCAREWDCEGAKRYSYDRAGE
jgi:hypothetical protein